VHERLEIRAITHTNGLCKIWEFRQLENLQNGTLKPGNITKSDIINIRNYLIVILCIINAARASNIINTTVADVEAATQGSEFPGWCFKSKKYKTSMIYGTKVYLRFG